MMLQENEQDRRQRHLVITRVGKTKLQEAFQLWLTAQDRLTSLYGENEMAELRKTLDKIAHDDRLP
jgi:DNA-binding MarR family transcriptional regulator